MGYYINKVGDKLLPANGKAIFLINNAKAELVKHLVFQPNLVCVVENGIFDAAGYCYNEAEFKAFNYPDGRPRTWLIVPDAANLAGYKS